jgi:hypothetical protein
MCKEDILASWSSAVSTITSYFLLFPKPPVNSKHSLHTKPNKLSPTTSILQPANALEQRIYDLMRPFRSGCYEAPDVVDQVAAANRVVKLERRVLVLARISGASLPHAYNLD